METLFRVYKARVLGRIWGGGGGGGGRGKVNFVVKYRGFRIYASG